MSKQATGVNGNPGAMLQQRLQGAREVRRQIADALAVVEERLRLVTSRKALQDLEIDALLNERNELPDPQVTEGVAAELRRRLDAADLELKNAGHALGSYELAAQDLAYKEALVAFCGRLEEVLNETEQLQAQFGALLGEHLAKGVAMGPDLFSLNKLQKALTQALAMRDVLVGRRYSLYEQAPPVVGRLWVDPKTNEARTVSEGEFARLSDMVAASKKVYWPHMPDGKAPWSA